MSKKIQTFNLVDEIRKYFDIQAFESIIPWAEKNIDFSKDISAQRNRLDFSLYPYQVEVIKQWEDLNNIKTVTVVAPEQLGVCPLAETSGGIMEKLICILSGCYGV